MGRYATATAVEVLKVRPFLNWGQDKVRDTYQNPFEKRLVV